MAFESAASAIGRRADETDCTEPSGSCGEELCQTAADAVHRLAVPGPDIAVEERLPGGMMLLFRNALLSCSNERFIAGHSVSKM